MAWQTPKTNWAGAKVDGVYTGDRFHVDDYNRIAGNLRYLHVAGENVYHTTVETVEPLDVSIQSVFSADIMNAVTNCLFDVCGGTFLPQAYTGKKTYVENGKIPNSDDLNMLESTCRALYEKYDTFPKSMLQASDSGFIGISGEKILLREMPTELFQASDDFFVTSLGDEFIVRG